MYTFTWTNVNIWNTTVVKSLNEITASLGWRVVYAWVGDDPCEDGDYFHGLV